MSELRARLHGWREAVDKRLPPWSSRALAGFFIVIGIVLPFAFSSSSAFMNATIIALAYAVMSLGLNIVVGFAGLLDLGYVAFYALGAYSLGWFGSGFFFKAQIHVLVSPVAGTLPGVHLNFILILIAAALICAAAGTVIGLPTLRLRGDYIAIVTLAFGEIIGDVAVNGQSVHVGGGMTLTAGNLGISAVDAPYFPGIGSFGLLNLRPWYWLIFAILLVVLFVNLRLRDSRLGRAWIALREDEVAAVSMGIPLVRTKLLAYAMGARVRRHVGSVFRHLLHRGQRRAVPVRVLDLHPRHGDHRRARVDLGGGRRRDGAGLHQQLPDSRRPQRHPGQAGLQLPAHLGGIRHLRVPAGDRDAAPAAGPDPGTATPARAHGQDRPGGRPARGGSALHRRSDVSATEAPAPPAAAILRAEHVTKTFGGLVAVNDVSFEVPAHSIVSLIGPNGAGKTTLFNMLTGLYRPTEGRIMLGERNITHSRPDVITKYGVARTFQNIRLFGAMTAVENVMVGHHARMRAGLFGSIFRPPWVRREERETREHARELLAYVGLREPVFDRLAAQLPYGDQRRVEIARALASQPRLLLLDEPTAGMNPQESAALTEFMRKLRDELELTILLIEHDMKVVMGVSERVTVLDYGKKIAEGAAGRGPRGPRRHRGVSRKAGVMTTLLEVADIHTYYGAIEALKGVSLTVEAGEVVTLIGSNGAGKSTTLRSISGLTPARSGKITFAGEDITRVPGPRDTHPRDRAGPGGPALLRADDRAREPGPGRAPATRPRDQRRPQPRLRAFPPAQGARAAERPARCPAASSRCSPSGGR